MIISFLTTSDAVAVSANIGTVLIFLFCKYLTKSLTFKYANLKSCHRSLRQCASSIMICDILNQFLYIHFSQTFFIKFKIINLSGAQ